MLNQQHLNDYFSGPWRQRDRSLDRLQKTGWSLIDKIKPGELVVDVGCGSNPFKGKIPNLVGFDPAFDEADMHCTLEEYVTRWKIGCYDVAFCLGSINFGDAGNIEHQIGLVDSLLRGPGSRIYWRCNPGLKDHGNSECESVPFYPWSFLEHIRLSDKFNYRLQEVSWDVNDRIYAEWIKR